jgi:hypothetical protein
MISPRAQPCVGRRRGGSFWPGTARYAGRAASQACRAAVAQTMSCRLQDPRDNRAGEAERGGAGSEA